MKSRLAFVCLAISAFFAFAVPANASKNLYFATGDDDTNAIALAFSLSADGTPAPLQTFTGTAGGFFNGVSMSPDGKFLFMADYNANEVRSLVVAPDGTLSDAPGSPTNLAPGSGPYGSAVTPDGKFVIFGMYDGHGIQVFSIGENGSLTPAPGGLVELDPAAYPYGVAISTDSRTLYVPDYATDSLYALRIEAGGTLTELTGSPLTGITNAYHAAVTPDGKYLYVPNYTEDLGVYGFSLDSEGLPTPLSGSPFPVMTDVYGGFEMSPDGKTLYSSGTSNEIQSASIAPDGSLTTGPSIMAGDYNPGLALNPAGTRLYNGMGDTPTGDRLDAYSVSETGALTSFGLPLPLPDTVKPDSDSMVVTPAQPPVAALTVSASKRKVTFDASGSTDPDGTIASYDWDFGDGKTATTTTPTTTHNYASDGNFEASLTVTDADNCSTGLVFTGRTPYCNGSDVAKSGATVSVDSVVKGARISARKVQKQKGRKLVIKVKAGAKETVRVRLTGNARLKKLKGKLALKKVNAKTGAGKYRTLALGAKSKKRGRAAVGRKGKATITAKFTDARGNSTTRKITVRLK